MLVWSYTNRNFNYKDKNTKIDSLKLYLSNNENLGSYFYTIKRPMSEQAKTNNTFYVSRTFKSASDFSIAGIAVVVPSWGTKYPYRFFDLDFNLSEDSYNKADNYYNFNAVVQKKEGGKYQYRDTNGILSEKFYFATNYSRYLPCYGLVEKNKRGKFQFRNMLGDLGEEFYCLVGDYKDGYIQVRKEKDGPIYLADLSGRIIKNKDSITKALALINESIDNLEKVKDELFSKDVFVNAVLNIILANKYDKKYKEILYKKIDIANKKKKVANLVTRALNRAKKTAKELNDSNLDNEEKVRLLSNITNEVNNILEKSEPTTVEETRID